MGYDWKTSIGDETIIKAEQVNEVKTSLDWLLNNLACPTHNGTVLAANYSGDKTGYYTGYNAAYKGSNNSPVYTSTYANTNCATT